MATHASGEREALEVARAALTGRPAWVVGGAVRDRLLGRPPARDVDIVVDGDPASLARAVGRAAKGPAFELSGEFGAWRVIGPERRWQIDLTRLQGDSLDEDLARRDFTVDAIAEPLEGGPLVDPHGGAGDAAARRLRMTSERAFDDDPLRALRLARLSCDLRLEAESLTVVAARKRAARIREVAPERVFAELRGIVAAERALEGLALMDRLDLTRHVLPELWKLRGVEQNRYHHLDVHDHTLAVLEETIALERDPAPVVGDENAAMVVALLAEPLADELTRGGALRFAALLHDVAKPDTQVIDDEGEVLGFPGHAELGADQVRTAFTRLRTSERLRAHVAALTRHHLRLGFLVHEAPFTRRVIHRYLAATTPVEVDVTLLSLADRLATRGRKADHAIAMHLDLGRIVLPDALDYRAFLAQPPLIRGDELAAALGIQPGPQLGSLLAEITEARYAEEICTAEEAIALARGVLSEP